MQYSAVAIGTFDGLHRGHRYLINQLIEIAQQRQLSSVVITLERPVRPVPGVLTTLEEKIELLRQLPIDKIVVLPVSPEIIDQPASVFFEHMLIDQLKIRHLVIGQNFAFGYHREGDVSWLKKKCPRHRVVVTAVSPRQWKKEVISSSRIRALLEQGEIEHANELLGRAYQIQGMPEPGRGVGRTLGFPTVNLAIPSEKLLPRGVFAGLVRYKQSLLPVVLNIGTRPTFFVDGTVTVEVNIIDFHGIWPLTMTTIYLCHRLRPELKFSNAHELQAQLAKDVDEARALFTRMRLPHPPNPV